jgi:O-antigen ligase
MVLKLPFLSPFFPIGAKEVLLLSVVAACLIYATLLGLTAESIRYLSSSAFVVCFIAIAFVCGHIVLGASRQTVSLAALQISLFPLLFLVVGGVQTDLRTALTWLSIALIATGVLSLPFVFWDAITGDAYILKNIDRSREVLQLTWVSYEGARREAGIFEGGLQLCSHLGLAAMGAVYLVLRKRYRVVCLSLLPFFALGIALSLSRLGLLAMMVGLLVLFGAFRHRRLLQVAAALFFAVLGLHFLSAVFPDALQRFAQRSLSVITGDEAQAARYQAWSLALDTMIDSPYGVGIGTAGGKAQRESLVLIPESTFLKFGVELGIVAMLAFIATYVLAIRRVLAAVRRSPVDDDNAEQRLDIAFLFGLVVATLVNHAFVQAIEYFSYGITSMIVLGMALNLRSESDPQSSADDWQVAARQ